MDFPRFDFTPLIHIRAQMALGELELEELYNLLSTGMKEKEALLLGIESASESKRHILEIQLRLKLARVEATNQKNRFTLDNLQKKCLSLSEEVKSALSGISEDSRHIFIESITKLINNMKQNKANLHEKQHTMMEQLATLLTEWEIIHDKKLACMRDMCDSEPKWQTQILASASSQMTLDIHQINANYNKIATQAEHTEKILFDKFAEIQESLSFS